MRNKFGGLLVASLAFLAVPEPAYACCTPPGPPPDPCLFVARWSEVKPVYTVGYPLDGLLLVSFYSNFDDEPAPDQVEFAVSLDGTPIPGNLEWIDAGSILGWRPEQPFSPSAIYQVSGSIANPQPPPGLESCVATAQPFAFEFAAWNGMMAPLAMPALSIEDEVVVSGNFALDNLVCCDGALPYEDGIDACFGPIETEPGACLTLKRTGDLQVTIEASLPDPWQAQTMVAARVLVDGVPDPWVVGSPPGVFTRTLTRPHPFCVELTLRNLVTGDVLSVSQQCHGDDVADQLGPKMLEPDSPEIAKTCAGPTYRCEVNECGNAWGDQCTPWPPEDGTTGAATTGATTTDANDPDPGGSLSASGPADSSPGQDGLVEHGCACNLHDPSPGWLLLVGCLVLAHPIRRRC